MRHLPHQRFVIPGGWTLVLAGWWRLVDLLCIHGAKARNDRQLQRFAKSASISSEGCLHGALGRLCDLIHLTATLIGSSWARSQLP